MNFSKPLLALLFSSSVSYASTLAVYQDKTFYKSTPTSDFIGLTKNVSAKCDGVSVALVTMESCPPTQRLCQELESLESMTQEIRAVDANTKVLAQLTSLPQPETLDASSWISAAKLVGDEQASLQSKKEKLTKNYKRVENNFRKQAPSKDAKGLAKSCEGELELTIPYGFVSFATSYEAALDDKEVTVTQNLRIINKSGVDIAVDSAMFYYRMASQYVRPIHFSPWIVKKYEPRPKKQYNSAMAKSGVMMERAMMADAVMPSAMPAPVVSYEDAREYKVTNLALASTGEPKDVTVLSWSAPMSCALKVYPYANKKVFEVCSFKPKYQIDSNQWKVKDSGTVINEKAQGQYRDGKYNLYTQVEEDIKVERKPIVKKERETGIFGGTARKKDGFTLILTNKSNKEKALTVVERIPTSTTTEISSKLLGVTSKEKIDYELLKDGQIKMPMILKANEVKKIDVLFELSYDKDMKVNY